MVKYDYDKYKNIVKSLQTEKRFNHSVNVSLECERLAKIYGCDVGKCKIAGILHDITKEFPIEKQYNILENSNIKLDEIQLRLPGIIHPISGSVYIKEELNISDVDIINAVKYHTTGRENMSLIEKVVFVSDYTSKERHFDVVEKIREASNKDIDMAVLERLKFVINDKVKKVQLVHPNTILAYNYILTDRRFEENGK